MGFVPESMLTMGRWPELLRAFAGLAGTIQGGGTLPRELKQLVAFVSSTASGCRYCQANCADLLTGGQPEEQKRSRQRRFFQTSAGYLRANPDDGK